MDADNRGDYNIYIELSTVLCTDELKKRFTIFFQNVTNFYNRNLTCLL